MLTVQVNVVGPNAWVLMKAAVSCMSGTRRCPVSSARSAQKFGGKNKKKKKNMKK